MKQGSGCEETWGREPSESPRGSLASADGIRAAWGGALAGPLGQSQLGGTALLHSWLVRLLHLSAVSLWASQFTLLSFSLFICKWRMIGGPIFFYISENVISYVHEVICRLYMRYYLHLIKNKYIVNVTYYHYFKTRLFYSF